MAVIAIFSGSYCQGEEIARQVADKLDYNYLGKELLEITAQKYNIPTDKLIRIMRGPTPFFNRLSHEKERFTAYLKTTLAETIQNDNLVIHGFKTLLLPDYIAHVLKVCIIAEHRYRVDMAIKTDGVSAKEADNQVRKFDQYIKGLSPWDEELYDIIIPMHNSSVDQAVTTIIQNAQKTAISSTPESEKSARDFLLAAKVSEALVDKNPDVEVSCIDNNITILINKFVKKLDGKKRELQKIASAITGVKGVEVKVGPKFHVPSIYPAGDFEMPQKILLVDDEKEFVHTLSERLQTRNLESAVVYDGEEALSFVEGEEPEVMVLDLKMPGIDGIEVLRRVKQNHPKTEVIILTGHGSEKEERLAAELGAFAYLQKPVDIDRLSETMKEAYKKIKNPKATND